MRRSRRAALLAALLAGIPVTIAAGPSTAFVGGGAGGPVLLSGNVMTGGRLAQLARTVAPADFAPAACASLGITELVAGSGNLRAPSGAPTLILGSAAADRLRGDDGDDCLVGGDGNDLLVGGDGVNTFDGGGGWDVCIGLSRVGRYKECEVVLP
jgi:Ca2+-binding RTX toxin-like protein